MSTNLLFKLSPGDLKAQINLVCFPFAGGGTINYRKWLPHIDQTVGLYAICLPGRESLRSIPFSTNYRSLVNQLAENLMEQSIKPMIMFGHSYGAMTAYFTALELQNHYNVDIEHLFISARPSPFEKLANPLGHLPDEEFLQKVISIYQGIPDVILNNEELLKFFLPIMKKDFQLYEQYSLTFSTFEQQVISCPITSIAFSQDIFKESDFNSWQQLTAKEHNHITLPGGHFSILESYESIITQIRNFYSNI